MGGCCSDFTCCVESVSESIVLIALQWVDTAIAVTKGFAPLVRANCQTVFVRTVERTAKTKKRISLDSLLIFLSCLFFFLSRLI